jgi:hypothetical protein
MTYTCFKNTHRFMFIPLLCLGLSACDTPPTAIDQHFGNAVKQAQAQQTLQTGTRPCMQGMTATTCPGHERQHQQRNRHEHMKKNHAQQADTDGVTAQAAVDRYHESFKSPPAPAPAFSIGLGTSSTR